MRKATLVLLAVLAMPVSSARADDKATEELLKALRTLNEAFTKSDAGAIRRLMTDDHLAITPYYDGGMATKEEQIRSLPDLKLSEYKTGKESVRFATPDVAIISYPLAMKGAFKGKPVAPKSLAVAVWVRRGGKWLETLYQETALGER